MKKSLCQAFNPKGNGLKATTQHRLFYKVYIVKIKNKIKQCIYAMGYIAFIFLLCRYLYIGYTVQSLCCVIGSKPKGNGLKARHTPLRVCVRCVPTKERG
jgi:hypothetical protein